MKRILLIFNDLQWLTETEEVLESTRPDWDVVSVDSAAAGLGCLAEGSVDVMVCELGIRDAAETEFFCLLPSKFAHLTHVVVLEQEMLDLAARRAPNAAMYLCTPCSAECLRDALTRVVLLRDLMNGERIKTAVGRIKSLPSLPQIYSELMRLLRDPDAGAMEVAEVIQQDIGMTAKVLQMANSSYFALPREITNVRMAVTYIGFKLIQNLALSVTLFDKFSFASRPKGFDPEEVQRHAFRTATAVFRLFKNEPFRDDAFSAAMLHDVGKLVMCAELADAVCRVKDRAATTGADESSIEREIIGADHGEIGGFLLMEWGLPVPVVEAVTHHHCPSRVGSSELDVVIAVHIANALVGEWEAEAGLRGAGQVPRLDLDLIDALGLTDRIPAWREQVLSLCAEGDFAPVA